MGMPSSMGLYGICQICGAVGEEQEARLDETANNPIVISVQQAFDEICKGLQSSKIGGRFLAVTVVAGS